MKLRRRSASANRNAFGNHNHIAPLKLGGMRGAGEQHGDRGDKGSLYGAQRGLPFLMVSTSRYICGSNQAEMNLRNRPVITTR
jgi:hypothetical protein